MAECVVQIRGQMPYFAELAYYLWGQVNYNSFGNCRMPTDRSWTSLVVRRRTDDDEVEIEVTGNGEAKISGRERTIARTALFLLGGCVPQHDAGVLKAAGEWDHAAAAARAALVRIEFEQPALAPFDSHFFWGSWKWVGWFATDCAWVGRWIMHSLVRGDQRAIPLCIDWLREVRFPKQAAALCHALEQLSGERGRDASAWIRWYDGTWMTKGAKRRFPAPDLDAWLAEMKLEFPDSQE